MLNALKFVCSTFVCGITQFVKQIVAIDAESQLLISVVY